MASGMLLRSPTRMEGSSEGLVLMPDTKGFWGCWTWAFGPSLDASLRGTVAAHRQQQLPWQASSFPFQTPHGPCSMDTQACIQKLRSRVLLLSTMQGEHFNSWQHLYVNLGLICKSKMSSSQTKHFIPAEAITLDLPFQNWINKQPRIGKELW